MAVKSGVEGSMDMTLLVGVDAKLLDVVAWVGVETEAKELTVK